MPAATNRRAAPLPQIDEDLLDQLRLHRVLTTAQAADATGIAVRTASYRLRLLRGDGLVDRSRPRAVRGSSPHHWWLTTAGHSRLRSATRVDGTLPELLLAHATATAAFPLALAKAGPPLHLDHWTRDYFAWHDWKSDGNTRRLTPDGLALVRVDGYPTPLPVFVEIDRATMPHRRLRAKLDTYVRYATEQVWRERHTQCPILLFLTTSAFRAAGVLADAKHATGQSLFSSATAQLVIAVAPTVNDPAASIADPVWQTEDHPARTLSDLLRDCLDQRARHPLG